MKHLQILILIMLIVGVSSCNANIEDNLEAGNTAGNINNFGIIAFDGEWEYFWAGTTNSVERSKGKLCKMKTDGSNFQILSDDNVCYINLAGEWVYFIKNDKSLINFMGKIYRITKDGKRKQEIYNGNSTRMTVVGDWIYFINLSDGKKVYKIRTDGTDLIKLVDSASYNLQYENGWLYFTNETSPSKFSLYKLSILPNSKPIKIFDHIDSFIISNSWIYGSNSNNGIFKIKNDGTGFIKIFNGRISNFNVSENYIYCSGENPEYFVKGKGRSCYLYKLSLDGKEVVKLENQEVIYRDRIAGLTSEHVYYWVNCIEWDEVARMKNDGTGDEILIHRLK